MPSFFPDTAVSAKWHDGRIVHQHTLTGKGQPVLKVIDLGAAITNLLVPDDDHTIQIFSDRYAPLASDMAVTDRLESVAGRPNDLRQPRVLHDVIPQLDYQHGDLYRINSHGRASLKRAARLAHPSTGIAMDVHTSWSYLQFYTGAGLDGTAIAKSGLPYHPYAGLCLECEDYPNGVNAPHMGKCILKPGTRRKDVTLFSFSNQSTPSGFSARELHRRHHPVDP